MRISIFSCVPRDTCSWEQMTRVTPTNTHRYVFLIYISDTDVGSQEDNTDALGLRLRCFGGGYSTCAASIGSTGSPNTTAVIAQPSEEQTNLVFLCWGPRQQPERDTETVFHCKATSETQGKAQVKSLIFYYLCSLKSRGGGGSCFFVLFLFPLDFLSMYIRICNMVKIRDGDIFPVRYPPRVGKKQQ